MTDRTPGSSRERSLAIEGDGVVLRPWRESDVDMIIKAANDPLLERFQHFPAPYTRDHALWWINEGSQPAEGRIALAIVDPANGQIIGGCGYGAYHAGRRQAEIGYWVASWARGRGVATVAVRCLADRAFQQDIARLELLVAPDNPMSQRVAINAGFTREGLRRAAGVNRDGSRHDLIGFARLSDDPAGPAQRLIPDLPQGVLTDGVVTLRRMGPEDIEVFYDLMIEPSVLAVQVGTPRDRAFAERRCHHAESEWLAGTRADCMILDAVTREPVGDIGLYYQEPFTRQAMIGYALRPEFRGRGVATRAAKLIGDWAFEQLDLVRLIAGTKPENEASQRVLMRAGFTREAYMKARLPAPDGGRIDDIQFVRFNPAH